MVELNLKFRALPGALTGYLQLLIPGIQSVLTDKAPDVNMKIHTLHFITMAMNTHESKVRIYLKTGSWSKIVDFEGYKNEILGL